MFKNAVCRNVALSLVLAFLCLIPSLPALAADVFILPNGAGSRDGSSWENAKPGGKDDFQAAWDSLSPGDTLFVGSGSYDGPGIKAGKGGEIGKPLRLVGVDKGSGLPLFTSNFDKDNPDKTGAGFFEASFQVSNFEIEGLRFKGYRFAVYMRGRNSNIKISKLDIEEAREGIRSDGGGTLQNPTSGSNNVRISDCRFIKYTKRGVRLEGGNFNWLIERCYADAGGKEWGTEPFHMGYQVANKTLKDSPVEHDIQFYDCVAKNSYAEATGAAAMAKPAEQRFWNGDGFCTEGGVTNIKWVRCVAMGCTDGGWDTKADGPEFIDCVSLDNKENFRLWGKKVPAKMTNVLSGYAFKRGGSGPQTGLWLLGSVEANNCTFIGNSTQVTIEADKAAPDAKLVFNNCIFDGGKLGAAAQAQLNGCIVSDEANKTDTGISADKNTGWDKVTDAYDSKTHPDKGFSSTRWGKK